jgi:co-chaperonin GroES (HSP10)
MMSNYFNPFMTHLNLEDGVTVQPYGTKVLVKVEERPRTAGEAVKFHLPDQVYSPSDRGIIAAIGENVENVKEGDMILYRWKAGDDFVVDGEHWLFLEEEEIYAIIGPAEEGPKW